MFSISHTDDGAFRLEIHADPSELDPESARRLRGVLLGLARQIGETDAGSADGDPRSATDVPPSRSERAGREP